MPTPPITLNLLQLLASESQQTHVEKINFNFDQILSLGGGPPGVPGIQGVQGVPGAQGNQGAPGTPGLPGTQWYVQPSAPLPPLELGDYWFNSLNSTIYEWDGSVWVPAASISSTGLFKESMGDADRVVFTNTSALKSLVLSPIDYGIGAPTAGPYKLKIIGSPASAMINLGVVENPLNPTESPAATQATVSMDQVIQGLEYNLNVTNPTGDMVFAGSGTSFAIKKQSLLVSEFQFNGPALKIQLDNLGRNMGFSQAAGSGLSFHIGLHDALSNPQSRAFSIFDQPGFSGFWPSLHIRGAGAMSADSTKYPSGVFTDADHPQINLTASGSQSAMWRYRAATGGSTGPVSNTVGVELRTVRKFDEPMVNQSGRSAVISLDFSSNQQSLFGLYMDGGARTASDLTTKHALYLAQLDGAAQPQVLGSALSVQNDGRFGLGTQQWLADSNWPGGVSSPGLMQARLTVLGEQGNISGNSSYGGIHFTNNLMQTELMGVTAGQRNDHTSAGLYFASLAQTDRINLILATGRSGSPSGVNNFIGLPDPVGPIKRLQVDWNGLTRLNSVLAVSPDGHFLANDPDSTVHVRLANETTFNQVHVQSMVDGALVDAMRIRLTAPASPNQSNGHEFTLANVNGNATTYQQNRLELRSVGPLGSLAYVTLTHAGSIGIGNAWTGMPAGYRGAQDAGTQMTFPLAAGGGTRVAVDGPVSIGVLDSTPNTNDTMLRVRSAYNSGGTRITVEPSVLNGNTLLDFLSNTGITLGGIGRIGNALTVRALSGLSNGITFVTGGGGGTERMRVDQNGVLFVGTTTLPAAASNMGTRVVLPPLRTHIEQGGSLTVGFDSTGFALPIDGIRAAGQIIGDTLYAGSGGVITDVRVLANLGHVRVRNISSATTNQVMPFGIQLDASASNQARVAEIKPYKGSGTDRVGISFLTANAGLPVERMRIMPDGGVQLVSQSFTGVGTFEIPSTAGPDSSYATPIFITPTEHDRIMYLYPLENNREFTSGNLNIRMQIIGGSPITTEDVFFTNLDATGQPSFTFWWRVNACVIIPAGSSLQMQYKRNTACTMPAGAIQWTIKTVSLGR